MGECILQRALSRVQVHVFFWLPVSDLNNGQAATPLVGWRSWEYYLCNADCVGSRSPDVCISELLHMTMAVKTATTYQHLHRRRTNFRPAQLAARLHRYTCSFAQDYKSMIDLVRTLGTTAAGPKIWTATPPPLMAHGAYGMNSTVINTVFQTLVPTINTDNKLANPTIDCFSALGGSAS